MAVTPVPVAVRSSTQKASDRAADWGPRGRLGLAARRGSETDEPRGRGSAPRRRGPPGPRRQARAHDGAPPRPDVPGDAPRTEQADPQPEAAMHRPRRRRIVVASRPPHVANESSPKRNFERAYIGDSVHSARPLGARRFLMAEVRTSGLSRRGGCTRPQASQEASRTSSANPQQCCFLAPRRSSLRSRFRVVRPPIVISQIRSPSLALSAMPRDPPAHRESSRERTLTGRAGRRRAW